MLQERFKIETFPGWKELSIHDDVGSTTKVWRGGKPQNSGSLLGWNMKKREVRSETTCSQDS